MTLKLVGALMVVMGCGGVGFSIVACCRREIQDLRQMEKLLNEMEWELQYHLTPLPELCRVSAANLTGVLREILIHLGKKLELANHTDVRSAMEEVLKAHIVPGIIYKHLKNLGASLGRFDLEGQVQGLRSIKAACVREINELEKGKTERLRGYQTLALCAGAAIAILLI